MFQSCTLDKSLLGPMSPWTKSSWTNAPWTKVSLDNCPLDKFSNTDSNCQGDICLGNICPLNICPYQEYLSSNSPDFDETLKIGSWEHLEQIQTVTVTFVQAIFFQATFDFLWKEKKTERCEIAWTGWFNFLYKFSVEIVSKLTLM